MREKRADRNKSRWGKDRSADGGRSHSRSAGRSGRRSRSADRCRDEQRGAAGSGTGAKTEVSASAKTEINAEVKAETEQVIVIQDSSHDGDGSSADNQKDDEIKLDTSAIKPSTYIAIDTVNVRKEPSTDSETVGKLKAGDEITVYRTIEKEWCEVEFEGAHRYVASQFLTDPAQATSLDSGVYSYAKMESELKEYAARYPDCVSLNSLGETVDGRKLYYLRIGAEDAKYKVFVNAAIHAREYITTELVMKQIGDYLKNNASDKARMSDIAFYVVPMVNPDGVTISQFGINGLQKESTKETVEHIAELDGATNLSNYYRHWKSNAEGIDINRQFDALWEQYNDRVGHPSADHYKGTAPESTAEAKALVNLTKKEAFDRTISYHTAGSVIYWYFGQEGELYDSTKRFADRMSKSTGYGLDANYQNLDPAGYKDWAISKMNIPSLTIEVGSGDSPISSSQLSDIYTRNKNVFEETYLDIQSSEGVNP